MTGANHLEILVEEPSMEAFLNELLPRLLSQYQSFHVHPFQGKPDLLNTIESRLRAYAKWLPQNWRIIILVDRDEDDCQKLKSRLEAMVARSGLQSRTQVGPEGWQVVNRIVVEELEAWYFSDWTAVRNSYPRVPLNIPNKPRYRNPDSIKGGTWEKFESILQSCGYYKSGLPKIEVARTLGKDIDPQRSNSHSFTLFYDSITENLY